MNNEVGNMLDKCDINEIGLDDTVYTMFTDAMGNDAAGRLG